MRSNVARAPVSSTVSKPMATPLGDFVRTSTAPFGYMALLGRRYWLSAAAWAPAAALLIGVPTDVVANPWFNRVVPVRPLDYVVLALTSVLSGALLATYTLPSASATAAGGRTGLAAGVLGWFAVGCPVCNKLVVVLLGSSGALTYFAPIQPLLGLLAVTLSATALVVRLRGFFAGCRV
jgi:hypothetical protein